MKYTFTVTIETHDEHAAQEVRNEVAGAIEDFIESCRPPFDITVGGLEERDTPLDRLYVAKAQDDHQDEGVLEVDENAVVSYGADAGAYVQAWVWVENNAVIDTAIEALEKRDEMPTR
jgi:hypothetical protein